MIGGSDNDLMDGNLESDQILGSTGDDILLDGELEGSSYNVLIAGPGNDVLWPRNDPVGQDLSWCGAGTDIAHVDRADVMVGC